MLSIELIHIKASKTPPKEINEGYETPDFWKLVGGIGDYANNEYLQKRNWSERFFQCTSTPAAFQVRSGLF